MGNAASSESLPWDGRSSLSPPPPAALPEQLVEEILLRFPPDKPASLFRAALVCKPWRRLISSARFRRRYSKFHRAPPMLGVFCRDEYGPVDHFVRTTAFRPRQTKRSYMRALDARHGRVLLRGQGSGALVVWDPVTGEERKVPFPPQHTPTSSWTAAVLCAAAAGGGGGCGHLDCHGGPFVVVFAGTHWTDPAARRTFVWAYSSDAAAWSEPVCGHRPGFSIDFFTRSALVGNALYFVDNECRGSTALKYNFELHQISWISLPSYHGQSVLTAMEDGGLGLAAEHESKLYIWSTKDADEVDPRWEENRVIQLRTLLPADADFTSLDVVGSTDDLGVIFMRAGDVVYAVDLKNHKGKKVCKGKINTLVPYMRFYTPAGVDVLTSRKEASKLGASSTRQPSYEDMILELFMAFVQRMDYYLFKKHQE